MALWTLLGCANEVAATDLRQLSWRVKVPALRVVTTAASVESSGAGVFDAYRW